jgi:flagellar hook assembly protein FlgD
MIRYDVPAGGARVSLAIYDVSGRLVRSLVNEYVTAGRKSIRWDATDSSGGAVGSGVYFYRMKAGGKILTRKMVLIR